MEIHRVLIAVVLSLAVLVVWNLLFPPQTPDREEVREAFRLNQHLVPPGLDYVVVSKKRTDLPGLNLDMVQKQLMQLFQQIAPRTEKDLEQDPRA